MRHGGLINLTAPALSGREIRSAAARGSRERWSAALRRAGRGDDRGWVCIRQRGSRQANLSDNREAFRTVKEEKLLLPARSRSKDRVLPLRC